MTPLQPRELLILPSNPEFTFQKSVTDFFGLRGKNYMVCVDSYTVSVETAFMYFGNVRTACDTLRKWFCTYGVPEEISSNGGPPFDSQKYCTFLDNCGTKNVPRWPTTSRVMNGQSWPPKQSNEYWQTALTALVAYATRSHVCVTVRLRPTLYTTNLSQTNKMSVKRISWKPWIWLRIRTKSVSMKKEEQAKN